MQSCSVVVTGRAHKLMKWQGRASVAKHIDHSEELYIRLKLIYLPKHIDQLEELKWLGVQVTLLIHPTSVPDLQRSSVSKTVE